MSAGVRSFVLHSIRHTFMTRLSQSGCDAWTLARAVGHSDIRVSSRYVHPSQDATEAAILRLPSPPQLAMSAGDWLEQNLRPKIDLEIQFGTASNLNRELPTFSVSRRP
jgi:integrase